MKQTTQQAHDDFILQVHRHLRSLALQQIMILASVEDAPYFNCECELAHSDLRNAVRREKRRLERAAKITAANAATLSR